MKRGLLVALAGCLTLVMQGCDARNTLPTSESPAALPRVEPGTGVVRGKVTFTGTPPAMKTIDNETCHAGARPIKEESVVVGSGGALANVFVYLKGVSADPLSGTPVPVLDQVDCRYAPHAVAVQAGQPLTVRSSDPAIHNVHFVPARNPSDNLNMTKPGQSQDVRFAAPEFIRFKCDVHPWMTAYVGVFASPFFTVTPEAGNFELTKLPAGTYTLAAWHERLGEIEKRVTIDPTKPVEVDFNFAP